jgi:peptidoglycan hydrolase-like protein with peptidoglycan-binding domain
MARKLTEEGAWCDARHSAEPDSRLQTFRFLTRSVATEARNVWEKRMANPGQPTISLGAAGQAVKRLERALRRTPNEGLAVDGVFGAKLETAVKEFQQGAGLTADGIVGPATWAALPDGGPMPTLQEGSTGPAVSSLQTLLTNGAPGQWNTTPQGIDGNFGPHTKASVLAFQTWGGVAQDGIVGDRTWAVSLHAASATLETAVGLQFVID